MLAKISCREPSNSTLPSVRLFALFFVLFVLASCVTRQSVQLPEIDNWQQRTAVLGGRKNWQFSGRIGVSAGEDGFNGKIRWEQNGAAYQATVGGPLGVGTVRIEGHGRSVELTDKDGVRTELHNAETDLRLRYGWTIPVTSLRYWALGIPDPSSPATTELNDDGQLLKLEQRDWTVTISRYRIGSGQPMPSLLTAANVDTRVRIVIDRWRFFD